MTPNSRFQFALSIAIFMAGLFIIGRVTVRMLHKHGVTVNSILSNSSEPKSIIDRDNLSPEVTEQILEVYAQQNHPDLKNKVERFLASENGGVRCAAVTAAGYLDDESAVSVMQPALDNPGLADCALRGIGKKPSAVRMRILQEFIAKNKLDDMTAHEATLTRLAEISLLHDESEKANVTRSVIGDLGDLPSIEEKAQVFSELLSLRANDSNVLDLARKELTEEKSHKILTTSIGFLTPRDSGWLRANLHLMKTVDGPQLQAVVASTIEQICPTGWRSLLDKVIGTVAPADKSKMALKNSIETKCKSVVDQDPVRATTSRAASR